MPAAPSGKTGGLQAWERGAIVIPLALHGWVLYAGLFDAPELRFGFAGLPEELVMLVVASRRPASVIGVGPGYRPVVTNG